MNYLLQAMGDNQPKPTVGVTQAMKTGVTNKKAVVSLDLWELISLYQLSN